jgi:hypothetical protein
MRLLPTTLGVGVAVIATATVASATTTPDLSISPAAPHIDNNLTVSFKSPGIARGYSYLVLINGAGYSCNGQEAAAKTIKGPQRAGEKLHATFRPSDNLVTLNATTWCDGLVQASVTVYHGNGNKPVKTLQPLNFRFTAIP